MRRPWTGTVNLTSCGRSANHISLIRHTRPGESRRRTGENHPRIAQVDSAPERAAAGAGFLRGVRDHPQPAARACRGGAGQARRLSIEDLIDPAPSRRRDLVTAMLVAQVIAPASKLALARGLRAETASSSLGRVLGVAGCDEDDLYAAMDWALERKDAIENILAGRHLANGTLVLYDVSSAAFEGRTCPLGAIGHPRDGVKGRLQIVYGLLCSTAGIPVAIEVSRAIPPTRTPWPPRSPRAKPGSGLPGSCLVGDRGMLTHARIRDEVRPAQLDWISALRAPQIKALVEEGALQLSLFDTQDLLEISSPEFPGERLVCCHNPALAQKRAGKRQELLAATEKELTPIAAATRRATRPLRGKDKIALRVGKVFNHYKMAKHFTIEITDESFTFTRNTEAISPPRPPSTGSTCCAPACPNTPSPSTTNGNGCS